jgi:transketolase
LGFEELEHHSRKIRQTIVEMSHRSGAPHLGSSLSCVDILVSLYWRIARLDPSTPSAPNRDRIILSKGHAAAALYATLAARGFFPMEKLLHFCEPGVNLPEQPSPGCAPGVEWATGSLGHGLPVGLGMAMSARLQALSYRVICLLSDGECNEGSVWEAALFAPAQRLSNLAVVVDYNKWQATGRSQEVTALEPLSSKFEAFGWRSIEIDGHSHAAIGDAFSEFPDSKGRPLAIIAHTTKGKGVSFMEDDNNWHYRIPTDVEVEQARKELL